MQFVTPEFYIFQSHWLRPLNVQNEITNLVCIFVKHSMNKIAVSYDDNDDDDDDDDEHRQIILEFIINVTTTNYEKTCDN